MKKRTLPKGVPTSAVGFGDFHANTSLIVLLRPLLDRYVRFGLLRSTHPKDQALAEEVSRRFQLLGYQITSSGARPCASPVGRILAYAQGKTEALSDILRVEYEELGEHIRCVIVTDFEKTSSTAVVDEVHDDEAGGAIGVFKALVECELGDQLDPVLMTGSTLLVDDDLCERFLERARKWVSERDLSIEFRDEAMGRFHHLHGSGKDWAPLLLHHGHRVFPRRLDALPHRNTGSAWRGLGRFPNQRPRRFDHGDHEHEHQSTSRPVNATG